MQIFECLLALFALLAISKVAYATPDFQVMGHHLTDVERKEREQDFNLYDTNKDNLLDAQELRAGLKGVSSHDLLSFFNDLDTDNSGTISFAEYQQFAMSF